METSKRDLDHRREDKLRRSDSARLKQIQRQEQALAEQQLLDDADFNEDEVTFFEDFVAGGLAGSASVIVGHPFDTIKVRMQTSSSTGSLFSSLSTYGGIASLYRGLGAPLSAAAVVNAVIFASYGSSSRLYDQYLEDSSLSSKHPLHDSTFKAFTCGSFAGLVQCLIICPMEHIKCRIQIQHGKGSADNIYKGPYQATKSIFQSHGMRGLFRGWWITSLREVPAFGMYFSFYDYCKDQINDQLAKSSSDTPMLLPKESHAWFASAMSGGLTGALTWGIIYPVDIVKTRIQTAPLNATSADLQMLTVGRQIVERHGWKHLFRGLNVTLIRAFPVNGIIFPVYEFCLLQLAGLEY